MLNIAVLKQDILINKKTILTFYVLQFASLVLATLIRDMRLMEISDVFWDTIPVVILPMLMQMALAYQLVKKRVSDRTMDFLLSTNVEAGTVIATKALCMILSTFLLLSLTILFGCLTHVYDLTGVWSRDAYIVLNLGGMCLQMFTGGWCFLISCAGKNKKDRFYWGVGAGVLLLFYAIYLCYYLFPGLAWLQYLTVFKLFEPASYAHASLAAMVTSVILAALGLACYWYAGMTFGRRSADD